MTNLGSKKFWLQALERALKTFAQVLVGLIGTEFVEIHSLDWLTMLSVAATATVVSVLTSLADPRIPLTETSPEVVKETEVS